MFTYLPLPRSFLVAWTFMQLGAVQVHAELLTQTAPVATVMNAPLECAVTECVRLLPQTAHLRSMVLTQTAT